MTVWTEPLPKVAVPTIAARPLSCRAPATISRSGDALVGLPYQTDPCVLSSVSLGDLGGGVGRTVVHHDDLEAVVGLDTHGAQGAVQIGCRVPRGYHHGDGRRDHHGPYTARMKAASDVCPRTSIRGMSNGDSPSCARPTREP